MIAWPLCKSAQNWRQIDSSYQFPTLAGLSTYTLHPFPASRSTIIGSPFVFTTVSAPLVFCFYIISSMPPPSTPPLHPRAHVFYSTQGHGRVQMTNALNINSSVGLFFRDWITITDGDTIEYEVSLYEDADLDKVSIDR